jgi:hypothetical protein
MDSSLLREIQLACDDVYCNPDDPLAVAGVQRLLGAETPSRGGAIRLPVPAMDWRR